MVRLTQDQGARLEQELISIFQKNPSERYQNALNEIVSRHPDLEGVLSINDLNYRIPKLRRAGKIPPSKRTGTRRGSRSPAAGQTHPVARAYQELDTAKADLEQARQRYEEAERNLQSVLRENLSQDFLERLAQERKSGGHTT